MYILSVLWLIHCCIFHQIYDWHVNQFTLGICMFTSAEKQVDGNSCPSTREWIYKLLFTNTIFVDKHSLWSKIPGIGDCCSICKLLTIFLTAAGFHSLTFFFFRYVPPPPFCSRTFECSLDSCPVQRGSMLPSAGPRHCWLWWGTPTSWHRIRAGASWFSMRETTTAIRDALCWCDSVY